jgi:hypothetical protein
MPHGRHLRAAGSLLAILVFPTLATAQTRIVEIKDGYCVTVPPGNTLGITPSASCASQVYFYRRRDKKIYVCGVKVNRAYDAPEQPIVSLPDAVSCFPLGAPPFPGEISINALGDRLNSKENSKVTYDMFSWQSGMWITSDTSDNIAFCVWQDESFPPNLNFRCTTKVSWNDYAGVVGIGMR